MPSIHELGPRQMAKNQSNRLGKLGLECEVLQTLLLTEFLPSLPIHVGELRFEIHSWRDRTSRRLHQ